MTQSDEMWAVSSVGVGAWQPAGPGSLEAWRCPGSDGPDRRLVCWKQAFFSLLAPSVPTTLPLRRGGRDGRPQPTAAGGWLVVPAQALRHPLRRMVECRRPTRRLPRGGSGDEARVPGSPRGSPPPLEGEGGSSARGLLSQGWPSLFDKLIAWRGLAGPGVTPVTTKVELEEIRLKEREKKKKKIKGGAGRGPEAETEGEMREARSPGSHFAPEAPSLRPNGIMLSTLTSAQLPTPGLGGWLLLLEKSQLPP